MGPLVSPGLQLYTPCHHPYLNKILDLSVPGRARADRQEADRALDEGPGDAAEDDLARGPA